MPETMWFPKDKLDHKVTFYIPSRTPDDLFANAERGLLIDATMRFLLFELGGATFVEAKGYFVSKIRGVIDCEDVTLCYAYCSREALVVHRENINQLANSLAIEFGQESLAVEIDSSLYFFEPTEEYRRRYDQLRQKWAADPSVEKVGFRKFLEIKL